MKLTVTIRLAEPCLPIEYRKLILSLFKNALMHFEEGKFLTRYYGPALTKDFCWALVLNQPQFTQEKIRLGGLNLSLIVSAYSVESSYVLLSAFLKQVSIPFAFAESNHMVITNVMAEPETKISKNAASFRLLSPLCLRMHERESNKDSYVSVKDARFVAELKNSIKHSLPEEQQHLLPAVDSMLVDAHLAKETVVRHYKQLFACTIGTLSFIADPAVLEHINSHKLGSRRAAGFGLNLLNEQWSVSL